MRIKFSVGKDATNSQSLRVLRVGLCEPYEILFSRRREQKPPPRMGSHRPRRSSRGEDEYFAATANLQRFLPRRNLFVIFAIALDSRYSMLWDSMVKKRSPSIGNSERFTFWCEHVCELGNGCWCEHFAAALLAIVSRQSAGRSVMLLRICRHRIFAGAANVSRRFEGCFRYINDGRITRFYPTSLNLHRFKKGTYLYILLGSIPAGILRGIFCCSNRDMLLS